MNANSSVSAFRWISVGLAGCVALAVCEAAENATASSSATTAPAVTKPARLSYAAGEVLKLARAKVGDETIVAFVKQSSSSYDLTAEDIVYLRSEGVTDRVVSAMLTARPVGGSTAEYASAPAPAPAQQVAAAAPAPAPAPAPSVAPGQTVYPGGAVQQPTTTTVVQPAVTYVQSPPTVVYAPPVVTEYYYGGPYYYGWGYPRPGISVSLGFGGRFHGGGWHVGVPVYRGGFHHR